MSTLTFRMTVSITAKFKADKNAEKRTPTSEGLAASLVAKTSQSATQRVPLIKLERFKHRTADLNWVLLGNLRFVVHQLRMSMFMVAPLPPDNMRCLHVRQQPSCLLNRRGPSLIFGRLAVHARANSTTSTEFFCIRAANSGSGHDEASRKRSVLMRHARPSSPLR